MSIQYRIAGAGDIELLIRSRMATLRAVNSLGSDYRFGDDFLEASRIFFLEGDQETVLAEDGSRIAGCATMCYYRLMPTCSHPGGKRARLMNVYTDPALRRQGIASRMVSMLIEAAWNRGVTEISLDATEAGRPLYRALGFTDSEECMVLTKTGRDGRQDQPDDAGHL